MCGSCGQPPITRAHVVGVVAGQVVAAEAGGAGGQVAEPQQQRGDRGLARPRSARPARPACPAARSRSRPSSASGPSGSYRTLAPRSDTVTGGTGAGRRAPAARGRDRARPAPRRSGGRTCGRGPSLSAAAGSPVTASNAASAVSVEHGERHPAERADPTAATPRTSTPHSGQPGGQRAEAGAEARRAAPTGGPGRSARHRRPRARSRPASLGAEGVQVGRAGQQVGDGWRPARRGPGWSAAAARRSAAALISGHGGAAEQQPGRQHARPPGPG